MAFRLRPIEGFTYREDGEHVIVTFEAEPSHNAFMALLVTLPENAELDFFDRFYPTISDPGAYVRVQRRGAFFIYYLNNHGWSSGIWAPQGPEALAAWLALNAGPLRADGNPLREMRIEPASSSPFQKPEEG